jgi:hypothetical protein
MEMMAGQPTKFQHCTKITTLTEIISTIESDVKILVVSCLTGIIGALATGSDSKSSIVNGMSMIGSSIRDLCRHRQGSLRVFIAPCTPRTTPDFQTHSKFAMVGTMTLLNG